jgi:hypothetical protein
MVPEQFTKPSDEVLAQSQSKSKQFSVLTALARIGVIRLLGKPLGVVPSTMSGNGAYYSRLVLPQNVQTFIDESRGMPASGAEATAVTSFGSVPLIVLTARKNDIPHWPEWQAALLQLSSSSKQLFAEESGHNIHIEEPQSAAQAILQMVNQVHIE